MNERTTKLTVDAGHPAVRIEVLDSGYRVQASGYGRIEKDLPTGYYTVQYKAADALQERDITLLPDTPLSIDDPPDLPFSSAAPLTYTSTSHEYHQDHANRLSRATTLERGHGSQIFVFVRDVEAGGRTHPAKGLSLHRLSGETVVIFDEVIESSRSRTEARWGGCNIEVDPGSYRLRLALPKGRAIEMALPACPGWQSQVFLLRQGGGSSVAGKSVLDLPNATQLMARPEDGFDPHNTFSQLKRVSPMDSGEDLRLMELARQALAHGYRGISSSDLRNMLWGKWRDPLLGILGLHLLLQQAEPDLELAVNVVSRLQGILNAFRHPDVDALALEIARRRDEQIDIPPFEVPPMLRHSWNILVKATAERPELIPYGSLAFQIAERLWGASAWLIWEAPSEAPTPESGTKGLESFSGTPAAGKGLDIQEFADRIVIGDITLYRRGHSTETTIDPSDFGSVRAAIEELLAQQETSPDRMSIDELVQNAQLTGTEFALMSQFQSQQSANRRPYPMKTRNPLSLDDMVLQLGLPAETVLEAMGNLYVKLKILAQV